MEVAKARAKLELVHALLYHGMVTGLVVLGLAIAAASVLVGTVEWAAFAGVPIALAVRLLPGWLSVRSARSVLSKFRPLDDDARWALWSVLANWVPLVSDYDTQLRLLGRAPTVGEWMDAKRFGECESWAPGDTIRFGELDRQVTQGEASI